MGDVRKFVKTLVIGVFFILNVFVFFFVFDAFWKTLENCCVFIFDIFTLFFPHYDCQTVFWVFLEICISKQILCNSENYTKMHFTQKKHFFCVLYDLLRKMSRRFFGVVRKFVTTLIIWVFFVFYAFVARFMFFRRFWKILNALQGLNSNFVRTWKWLCFVMFCLHFWKTSLSLKKKLKKVKYFGDFSIFAFWHFRKKMLLFGNSYI